MINICIFNFSILFTRAKLLQRLTRNCSIFLKYDFICYNWLNFQKCFLSLTFFILKSKAYLCNNYNVPVTDSRAKFRIFKQNCFPNVSAFQSIIIGYILQIILMQLIYIVQAKVLQIYACSLRSLQSGAPKDLFLQCIEANSPLKPWQYLLRNIFF